MQDCYDMAHQQEKQAGAAHTAAAARASQRRSDANTAHHKHSHAHIAYTEASTALHRAEHSVAEAGREVLESIAEGRQSQKRVATCMGEVMGELQKILEDCDVISGEVEATRKPESALLCFNDMKLLLFEIFSTFCVVCDGDMPCSSYLWGQISRLQNLSVCIRMTVELIRSCRCLIRRLFPCFLLSPLY